MQPQSIRQTWSEGDIKPYCKDLPKGVTAQNIDLDETCIVFESCEGPGVEPIRYEFPATLTGARGCEQLCWLINASEIGVGVWAVQCKVAWRVGEDEELRRCDIPKCCEYWSICDSITIED